ncbi:hypothetical protein MMC07_007743 [Pseudocyphellaria aurata]|nr:hypothetical protein [Pseudocyphellaria aurata]
MSLYYEAAPFLGRASLKSQVFSSKGLKSTPKQVFALVSEASKWSVVLKAVIENSQLLSYERKLTPGVALLLVHDLLLTRNGVAAPESHPLRLAVTRHKARLHAEFTKYRVRKGFASVEDLRAHVNSTFSLEPQNKDDQSKTTLSDCLTKKWNYPRWVRINTLRTSLDEQLSTTFADYKKVDSISHLLEETSGATAEKLLHIDKHIPNLLALPSSSKLAKLTAYQDGSIILQDKASCFPAYILNPRSGEGDVLDACAAPGNKTTQVAALLQFHASGRPKSRVWACERDKERSVSLKNMIGTAGAEKIINIKAEQDFLKLNPAEPPWNMIGSLLLDPSCSGSGIVGRDQMLSVAFPKKQTHFSNTSKSLKRKRKRRSEPAHISEDLDENVFTTAEDDTTKLSARLEALSAFQLKLLLHSFHFPKAHKVVYSTCSVYSQENEQVVIKALSSPIALQRRWRILRRDEQVSGAKAWPIRGDRDACHRVSDIDGIHDLPVIGEACIRCEKGTDGGTQGFFVSAFVRDADQNGFRSDGGDPLFDIDNPAVTVNMCGNPAEGSDTDQEWEGFSDEE